MLIDSGFTEFNTIFNFMKWAFVVAFIVVIIRIVAMVVLSTKRKQTDAIIALVTVVSKREASEFVSQSGKNIDTYYVTFQFDDGQNKEL